MHNAKENEICEENYEKENGKKEKAKIVQQMANEGEEWQGKVEKERIRKKKEKERNGRQRWRRRE